MYVYVYVGLCALVKCIEKQRSENAAFRMFANGIMK